jgi:peptide/nickel transport system ATP-binding protein
VPKLGRNKEDSVLYPIPGRVPDPAERENEICIFSERCDYGQPECRQGRPKYVEIESEHTVRCFRARDIYQNRVSFEEITKKPELKNGEEQVEKLLNVDNLKVYYEQESKSLASFFGMEKKQFVKAVDDISVSVKKGRTLGVVGESGCGKSTMVKGLIGLEEITDGQARFLNFDLDKPITKRERTVIQEMQMVFQNPDATLNPSYTIGQQIARPIKLFKTVPKKQIRSEVVRLLESVRLNETYYDRYPRQLSGGEKQRVGIARALASRPDLVICDEPVSALDVSVQAAVLNLLLEIQKRFSTSLIFIAHDLSVVRFFSDDVVIMYLGQIMEMGPVEAIYDPPYHPYTEALLSAVPIPDPDAEQGHIRLSGNVPSALNPPEGCRFHPRCPRRHQLPDGGEICARERPPRRPLEHGHFIQCHFSEEALRNMEELTEEDTAVSA